MPAGLFSIYTQGENRITSTLLAVLERLSFWNIERLLREGLLGDGDDGYQFIRFTNQPTGPKKGTVPDAEILPGQQLLVETKIKSGAAGRSQVEGHLSHLRDDGRLVLLTPDYKPPSFLGELDDRRVVWSNFRRLYGAIHEILEDTEQPPNEQEAFLLREFNILLKEKGLVDSPEDTVLVVAAGNAWPEYQKLHAYICQENRSFRSAARIAFYAEGKIQPLVPRIVGMQDNLKLSRKMHEDVGAGLQQYARELYDLIAKYRRERIDTTQKVLFLTPPESDETEKLIAGVKNDLGHPFTQGQRYVSLEALKSGVKTTTELVKINKLS